ncbi:hypothetical protein ALC62_09822 [Cyphomyrmex costatus]|uniref:Uncharacterized protein n=1 Tax=Cyphomyrmex costatus TaxID=456900 RepID=A0A195CFI3_9HYME|nr:hypothetical protein ALC62_09822 [Cyphomyrmex costatus]
MVAAILLTRSSHVTRVAAESREKRASTSAPSPSRGLLPASYGFVVDNARMNISLDFRIYKRVRVSPRLIISFSRA